MGVKNIGERYHCNVCGNEVEVIRVGGGDLICCGELMELIEGDDQYAALDDFDFDEE